MVQQSSRVATEYPPVPQRLGLRAYSTPPKMASVRSRNNGHTSYAVIYLYRQLARGTNTAPKEGRLPFTKPVKNRRGQASGLPVPVCAAPITSLPPRMAGMALPGSGSGFHLIFALTARRISGASLKFQTTFCSFSQSNNGTRSVPVCKDAHLRILSAAEPAGPGAR
jgi:hypothetical protein